MTTLVFDLTRGPGGAEYPASGTVHIKPTKMHAGAAGVTVLPFPIRVPLIAGKATVLDVVPSPEGAAPDWCYRIEVHTPDGATGGLVSVPDRLEPMTFKDLGTLTTDPTQPLYAGPTGPYTYITAGPVEKLAPGSMPTATLTGPDGDKTLNLGLVTGDQGLQGLPGNATMRIDTTVGTRIFITDGVTERMVSGETGWRALTSWGIDGVVSGTPLPADMAPTPNRAGHVMVRREGTRVMYRLLGITYSNVSALNHITGFTSSALYYALPAYFGQIAKHVWIGGTQIYLGTSAGSESDGSYATVFEFPTKDAWPTTLPGTPA